MSKVTFSVEGKQEFDDLVAEIINDFGQKDAKKVLQKAAYESMRPVLYDAKLRAPIDTGQLAASLKLSAGKPTRKQKQSKYIEPGDVVVATVSTSTIKQLAKLRFKNRKNEKNDILQVGGKSDARAMAMEFGTAKISARPFLRPALESNKEKVASSLGSNLKSALEKYKAKQAKKRI
jgi:HK97 gp10 family phage protein